MTVTENLISLKSLEVYALNEIDKYQKNNKGSTLHFTILISSIFYDLKNIYINEKYKLVDDGAFLCHRNDKNEILCLRKALIQQCTEQYQKKFVKPNRKDLADTGDYYIYLLVEKSAWDL